MAGKGFWLPLPGGGGVATDPIFDAAGDLPVGTGSDAAARLPMGTALQQIRVNAAGTALEYFTPTSGGGALPAIRIQVTPTISTSIYAVGDCVGGLMTFANAALSSGGSLRVEALQLADKGGQLAELDLVLFDRSITATTDNAAFDPTDTEITYEVGRIPISVGNYLSHVDNTVASIQNLGLVLELSGSDDLYGQLVARSAPTYASTSDLIVSLTVTPLD